MSENPTFPKVMMWILEPDVSYAAWECIELCRRRPVRMLGDAQACGKFGNNEITWDPLVLYNRETKICLAWGNTILNYVHIHSYINAYIVCIPCDTQLIARKTLNVKKASWKDSPLQYLRKPQPHLFHGFSFYLLILWLARCSWQLEQVNRRTNIRLCGHKIFRYSTKQYRHFYSKRKPFGGL